jgi:hypothetical protein
MPVLNILYQKQSKTQSTPFQKKKRQEQTPDKELKVDKMKTGVIRKGSEREK